MTTPALFRPQSERWFLPLLFSWAVSLGSYPAIADTDVARQQHAAIGIVERKGPSLHTKHPDAQWFPEAGLGLFLHWDEGSVRKLDASWPMIPGAFGEAWENKQSVTPEEIARISKGGTGI